MENLMIPVAAAVLVKPLAAAFVANLRAVVTTEAFESARYQNSDQTVYGPGMACASQNYCDANMPMAAAFETICGREPEVDQDADAALWNAAWDLAKAEHLTARRFKEGDRVRFIQGWDASGVDAYIQAGELGSIVSSVYGAIGVKLDNVIPGLAETGDVVDVWHDAPHLYIQAIPFEIGARVRFLRSNEDAFKVPGTVLGYDGDMLVFQIDGIPGRTGLALDIAADVLTLVDPVQA